MTKIFKINGMDCDSCAKMIELDLEDAGISAQCSYATKLLQVNSDLDELKKIQLQKIITQGGYKLSES